MSAPGAQRNLLVRNTFLLAAAKACTFIIPLVTTPYLARVLGLEQFGLLGIASNILGNLTILTDWGFSLSATREAAQNASDPVALRCLFWDTMAARGVLGVASLIIIVIIIASLGFPSPLSGIILAGWFGILGNVIWTGWFLQGIESMGPMVLAALIGRLLTVPLIFLFVHNPSDTAKAVAIAAVGGIVSGLISLRVAADAKPLMPVQFTISGAWRQLREGWHLFISMGAISLYTQINVIIVGAIAGSEQAGLLFGAEKLQNAGKSAIEVLSNAAYPRVCNLVAQNADQALQLIKRLLAIQGAMGFGIFAAMLAGSPYLTAFFLGADYQGAIPALRWLSITVFLVGLSNGLTAYIMLPFGMKRSYMRVIIGAGLFNIGAIVPLTCYLGATGASISIVSTELIIVVLLIGIVVWRAPRANSARESLELK
ncbi:MAG TPA: oligosaccharide flippase family protein [Methylocella sp.]|nr:oligosaccharide flippase family protein [Methylocella sp.]